MCRALTHGSPPSSLLRAKLSHPSYGAKDFALTSVRRGDEIECLALTIASNQITRSPSLS